MTGYPLAVEQHLAGLRAQGAVQMQQHGAFPRPIRAKNHQPLSALNSQVEPVERADIAGIDMDKRSRFEKAHNVRSPIRRTMSSRASITPNPSGEARCTGLSTLRSLRQPRR